MSNTDIVGYFNDTTKYPSLYKNPIHYKRHRNIEAFSFNEQKMKIVLIIDDFKKAVKLIILFQFINNRE